jgi:hypothetical protein
VLPTIEYSVTVPAAVDEAFRAFQNLDRLLGRGIYEEIVWIEGEPWRTGSRLRFEILRPLRATITSVVNAISPPRAIEMLNHALGVTAEQHVSFGPDLKGGTRIRSTLTLVGKSTDLSETEAREGTTFLLHDALDTVADLCQKRRASSAPGQ